jgi:predicted MFS family arabinose efflux permease
VWFTDPLGLRRSDQRAGHRSCLALGAGGGILGAIVTPGLARRFDHGRLRVAVLGVTAAADLALAAAPSPPMAALALALASAAFALWNVLSVSLRQRLAPADVLGRVNAANRTLSMTAALLGTLCGGWVAASQLAGQGALIRQG